MSTHTLTRRHALTGAATVAAIAAAAMPVSAHAEADPLPGLVEEWQRLYAAGLAAEADCARS
jgi:hypothetical protein